jgi:predicted kinase
LYLTVAPPASGKTTASRKIAEREKNIVVISVDDFRLAFYKEQYNKDKEDYLKQIVGHIIFALSKNPNLSIILDESAWLINKESRTYWIEFGKAFGFKIIALYFDKSLGSCLQHNFRRNEKKVPDSVICELNKQLEKPDLSEGFEDIIYG